MALGNEREKKAFFPGNKTVDEAGGDKPRRVEPLAMLCVPYLDYGKKVSDKREETPIKVRVPLLDEITGRMGEAEAKQRYEKAAIGFPMVC
jgi:hypothetical protein